MSAEDYLTGQYNYDFGYGDSNDVSSGNLTAGFDSTSSSGSSFWNQLGRALLGGSGGSSSGGMGAGLALGLGALAAALSRQQAPTVKTPEYKPAPVYNRALTSPMFAPQPEPQKSASGQNIYRPMVGMPLFFNPNPFQFDPTEAAKRYGPTPEQIAQGRAGYEAGLASLYKPMSITPFTYQAGSQPTTQNTTTAATTATPTQTTTETGMATGGPVDDLMVGYNHGGDIYMAAGRYLNGDGDGMSDSIPATINGKQPARLADGEFVIPADVVADLGNGSSNAGADKLQKMMKRIRAQRHGTTKQPPEVKAEKAMPA